jgi:DNA polymerase III alpha subunit
MNYDQYGRAYSSQEELCDLLYKNPDLNIANFYLEDAEQYNLAVSQLFADLPKITQYLPIDKDLEQFDIDNQNNWYMPDEYRNLDIAKWVLEQCNNEAQLQRVAQELLLFQQRDLFDLLKFLKYLVDTMRKNNIVWGVGRGSSVASYVLYLIGIHKIDSIYYDLPIEEFLKKDKNG